MTDEVSFNVIGACVSRNIFNINDGGVKYKVNGYLMNYNPALIFQKMDEGLDVPDDELINLDPIHFSHPFTRRMMHLFFKGDACQYLLENKADWVILDNYYSDLPIYEWKLPSGAKVLSQSNYSKFQSDLARRTNNAKLKQCKVNFREARLNFGNYCKELADFLKNNWGENVILLNAKYADFRLFDDEVLLNDYYSQKPDNCDDSLSCRYKFVTELKKHINCYVIDIPFDAISDDGESPVHYLNFCQEYLKKRVDNIVLNHSDPGKMMSVRESLDIEYGSMAANLITERKVSITEQREFANSIFDNKSGTFKDAIKISKQLIDKGDAYSYGILARAYIEGKGVKRDYAKAAELLRKASPFNAKWKLALSDILWRIGTEDSYAEAFGILHSLAMDGNPIAMQRTGIAYELGRGTEENLDKAVQFLTDAIDNGNRFARINLYDTYLKQGIKDPEKLLQTIDPLVSEENPSALLRVSRLYKDGTIVPRDLDKSANYMRKVVKRNIRYSNELSGILFRIGTEESYKEMVAVSRKFADAGNGAAMRTLGLAYRDGKGVPRDIGMSIMWYKKAVEKKAPFAKEELEKLEDSIKNSNTA